MQVVVGIQGHYGPDQENDYGEEQGQTIQLEGQTEPDAFNPRPDFQIRQFIPCRQLGPEVHQDRKRHEKGKPACIGTSFCLGTPKQ